MQACREAKEEGLRLQLPYISTPYYWEGKKCSSLQYIVPGEDILWLLCHPNLDYKHIAPLVCGKCDGKDSNGDSWGLCDQHYPFHIAKAIAISDHTWEAIVDEDDLGWSSMGSMQVSLFYHTSAPQFCIVTGDIDNTVKGHDLVFIEPTIAPCMLSLLSVPSRVPVDTDTWASLGKDRVEEWKKFKARRCAEIERNHMYNSLDFQDWSIPDIRYVEARSVMR